MYTSVGRDRLHARDPDPEHVAPRARQAHRPRHDGNKSLDDSSLDAERKHCNGKISMQKTCIINNYPMSYVEQGNGPTLLLVHGSLADYRYWAPQVSDLSSHFRVIALSLRYYWPWQWTGEDENFTIEQHASDIAAFISSIVGEPIHLIGHSRGAEVALQVALRFPELLNSLVLADPFVEFVSLMPQSGRSRKNCQHRTCRFRISPNCHGTDQSRQSRSWPGTVHQHGLRRRRVAAA